MCTVVTLAKNGFYFGRNMDIDRDFGQKVVVTPREYALATKRAGVILRHYAMIGAARVEDGYPLYAEACNETGLCMAALNFPGNAVYAESDESGKTALAPYELIPYILAKCADIGEAKRELEKTEIISLPFNDRLPLAPLHWIVADKEGCVTVERTVKGIKVFDNPYGVLTNNPPFDFHRENVKNYLGLSAENPATRECGETKISPFSQGAGAVGLPGDFSSSSRFVKAFFCKSNSVCGEKRGACEAQAFHILSTVAMPKGSVITADGKCDFTAYSCVIDAGPAIYAFRTYDSADVKRVHMTEEYAKGDVLSVFDMV